MKSACSRHTAPATSYEFSSINGKGCRSYRPANPHPSPLPAGEREQDRRARLQSKATPRPPCRAKQRHPQAERSDGPCGARSRSPAPLRRRGAQRAADQGPRLFERSEFERDPADREHRRAVRAADRRSGVAFLWFLSLAKQRKGLARGGDIPASGPKSRSAAPNSSLTSQPGAADQPGAALTPTLSQGEREQGTTAGRQTSPARQAKPSPASPARANPTLPKPTSPDSSPPSSPGTSPGPPASTHPPAYRWPTPRTPPR